MKARLRGLMIGRLLWLGVAALLLLPLLPRWDVLGAASALLGGAWVAGLGMGVGVNLLAPGVGRSPAWAGTLDAIRGVNPRMQAALLYAPGVALLFAGLPVALGCIGVELWLEGEDRGLLLLLLPYLSGLAGLGLAWAGRRELSAIGAVLGEVEAAWAQIEDPAEQRRVYMDWLADRMPERLRLPLLKDLRQGWRSFRASITASWAMAALAGLSGWSAAEDAPGRSLLIGGAGLAWVGWLGVRMSAADPPWLLRMLPLRWGDRLVARGLVLLAWSQPIVLVPSVTLGIRQGGWSLGVAMEGRALLLGILGVLCSQSTRGSWFYLPLALLVVLWGI